ncbi:MAG: hypothetical protein V2A73_07085, partial [Pseudomonadota bacterium]
MKAMKDQDVLDGRRISCVSHLVNEAAADKPARARRCAKRSGRAASKEVREPDRSVLRYVRTGS